MVLQGKGYIMANLSTLYCFSVWVILLFDNLFSQLFVQFSSVQDSNYALRKAHICAPPHPLEVSLTLPLKQFQCSSDRRWPSLILSEII